MLYTLIQKYSAGVWRGLTLNLVPNRLVSRHGKTRDPETREGRDSLKSCSIGILEESLGISLHHTTSSAGSLSWFGSLRHTRRFLRKLNVVWPVKGIRISGELPSRWFLMWVVHGCASASWPRDLYTGADIAMTDSIQCCYERSPWPIPPGQGRPRFGNLVSTLENPRTV